MSHPATSLGAMITTRHVPERLLLAMCGRTTRIVGYRAAAWIYGLDGIAELEPEFAVPHGTWRRGPFDHQRRRIDDLEIVEIDGVLITSVRQTLVDLCAVLDPDVVERAAESALRRGFVEELALRDFADLWAFSRHGGPGLREVLDRRPIGAPPTGSDLETQCLQVWRRGGVEAPQRQWRVIDGDGQFVAIADFGFPPSRFVVETDGLETHTTREQQQYDTNRQNRIWDAGYELRRFTYDDVIQRPAYVRRETLRGLQSSPICPKTSPSLRKAPPNRHKWGQRPILERFVGKSDGDGAEGAPLTHLLGDVTGQVGVAVAGVVFPRHHVAAGPAGRRRHRRHRPVRGR